MESGTPSIIDLNAELAKLTVFRGRTPQSTMADRKGSGGRLALYRDGALFTTKFAGKGHWESHLTGDELVHILDGTTIDPVPVNDGSRDEAQARDHVGCGFDFHLGAVRSLFAATRRAAASATRAHVTNSSGSSNSRSGARQKERSMVQPFFS